MRISQKKKSYQICGEEFSIKRTPQGVPVFWVKNVSQFSKVMGFLHAHDRMIQMMMVKVISQGRVCELLKPTAENLEIDIFVRELNFEEQVKKELAGADTDTIDLLQSYCDGVNDYILKHGYPFEFRLAGYRPDEWTPEDTLLSVKLMSYSGLAQTQQDLEKLIIQAIQQGVDLEKLKSLFTPHLDGVTTELAELISKVKVAKLLVPNSIRFASALPKIMASNNWTVGSSKTKSGQIIQCHDPHLECNRLPGVWYEFIGHMDQGYCMGANIPGVPGLHMGRTENYGLSFTYGFMDMVDFFIEEIRGEQYREGDEFLPLTRKNHLIRSKKGEDYEFSTYHTPRGIIEKEPAEPLSDGLYLSRCWAGDCLNHNPSLRANFDLLTAKSAEEAREIVQHVNTSCNWILGDKNGTILYQQSGTFPNRSHSGLYPLPGWQKENVWQGLHGPDKLASLNHPAEDFYCTANNDLNQSGKPVSINMPMGDYRVRRIRQLLESRNDFTAESMKAIQSDLYSLQAEQYMSIILPNLPQSECANVLISWDLKYDRDSRGATLFEMIYANLLSNIFGRDFISSEVWQYLAAESAMIVDFYHLFDRIILNPSQFEKPWFSNKTRDQYLKEAIDETLKKLRPKDLVPWGKTREIMLTNIFFQGALPNFLGFDKGPYAIEGGRATICQGAVYRAHGRATTFCPSMRFISDFSQDEAFTVIAGGPSDRRFSRYYSSDVDNWYNFKYKKLYAEI